MLRTGLVSVTFRKLPIAEIVSLAVKARLEGIEWGGDVHVPPGDLLRANEAQKLTAARGLQVASYGSYYCLGTGASPFGPVLETAVALGAPTIRAWAGMVGSHSADEDSWRRVVRDGQIIADQAAAAGLMISFEFHQNTLNDSATSALRLLREIDRANIRSCWQPLGGSSCDEKAQELAAILPWLGNLHVYHWSANGERRPLAEGAEEWGKYLSVAKSIERELYLLLEFVRGDSPEIFLQDAGTLRAWLNKIEAG